MLAYTNKYWKMLMIPIKRILVKKYGKEDTKKLLTKAAAVYRELLMRADDIGADNPMASNMYEALVLVALWKAAEGRIAAEDLEGMVNDVMSFPLLKLTGLFININKPAGRKKLASMMKKNQDWLEAHPQYKKYSWDFNFDEEKNGEGFYYHFTQCPINTFARKEGFLEILPIMCNIDYKTASLMHAKLYRESTLAKGGAICDYWFVGDRK